MDNSNDPSKEQTSLVPRWGGMPATPWTWEQLYLAEMAQPPTKGILGWWAYWRRRRTARRLGNEIFDEIQQAFQAALLARYNLSLQLDQGITEESNRLQLARARAQADDLLAQEAGRRIVARRIQMVQQLLEIRCTLKQMGVPDETVDRKIGQYVERLIDTLGTELTSGGNHEPSE